MHHWLRWLERTLNEYSLGLKAMLRETAPPDTSYSKAKSALQSCLEKLKGKTESNQRNPCACTSRNPCLSASYRDETNQASAN